MINTRLSLAGIDSVISALRSVSCQTVLMGTPPINCGQVWVQDKSASDRIHSRYAQIPVVDSLQTVGTLDKLVHAFNTSMIMYIYI